ncbi:endopeptidase La, partial [Candidatus Poribacteria bacterium]|nr:endopeptidase La [Candidatus Poribacteria bacterium]
DWMLNLPWSMSTEDSLDLAAAKEILDEDHYDLEKIKERILEYLAVRMLKSDMKGPIFCFVGPPGVGKTSLGKSIARAMNRKFVRISLGGMHDEAEIRGHRRTYIGSMPGRIIKGIRQAESNNPVFMLDEIDKLGSDFRGDPASALLEVLDPEQNHSFTDNYLDVPFDLSKVMFVTTANQLHTIPPPLRDRMETIELLGYTTNEKRIIAKQYLIPRQLTANGLKDDLIRIRDTAIDKVISAYTREAGVRNLERELGTLCRKVARRVAEGKTEPTIIATRDIQRYLGPAKFDSEIAGRKADIGVATGLSVTPAGGEILFIEAATTKKTNAHNQLRITGQIGDVMQESVQAALSYVKSQSDALQFNPGILEDDIHVHVPAGAIPKDGPSAGITIATALASIATRQRISPEIAMTGELTLRGRVLPIGGVKEKILAAKQAGIKKVILPEGNKKHFIEVPKDIQKGVEFLFVEHVTEVFTEVFT